MSPDDDFWGRQKDRDRRDALEFAVAGFELRAREELPPVTFYCCEDPSIELEHGNEELWIWTIVCYRCNTEIFKMRRGKEGDPLYQIPIPRSSRPRIY